MRVFPNQRRQFQAAIGKHHAFHGLQRLARAGQALQDGVPKQQLQQQRQIANDFDIGAGNARQQEILGKPRNANRGAKDGRQHYANYRDLQRIQNAHHQRAQIGIRGLIGNQAFGDGQPRFAIKEAKAGRDAPHRQIVGGIAVEPIDQATNGRDDHDLPENAAHPFIRPGKPERTFGRAPLVARIARCARHYKPLLTIGLPLGVRWRHCSVKFAALVGTALPDSRPSPQAPHIGRPALACSAMGSPAANGLIKCGSPVGRG